MAALSFTLNGDPVSVDVPPDSPLLYVLRNSLGLNSPRYGCGQEQCGACRVLVDGDPAWACTFRAGDANGTEVRTVEGLGEHPLKRAFLDLNAAQCGYCSSGILMSAWHLLEHNDAPSRTEIQAALEDHLCRCGAHNRVIKAIERAAELLRQETGS